MVWPWTWCAMIDGSMGTGALMVMNRYSVQIFVHLYVESI